MNPFKTAALGCMCASLTIGCSNITQETYQANSNRFQAAATALRSTTRPSTVEPDNDILPVDLSQTYVGLSPGDTAYIQYRDGEIERIAFQLEEEQSDRCRHLVHIIETEPTAETSSVSHPQTDQGLCGPIRRSKRLDSEWRVEVSGRRLNLFF